MRDCSFQLTEGEGELALLRAEAAGLRQTVAGHERRLGELGAELLDWHEYHELFAPAEPHQLWGEGTSIYMFLPFVAGRIRDYNPDVKLIFLLRDPVRRAFSQHKMECSRHWERWPFALAAALECPRVRLLSREPHQERDPIRIMTYLSRGFYSAQVEGQFPRKNCLLLKCEELLSEHDRLAAGPYLSRGRC